MDGNSSPDKNNQTKAVNLSKSMEKDSIEAALGQSVTSGGQKDNTEDLINQILKNETTSNHNHNRNNSYQNLMRKSSIANIPASSEIEKYETVQSPLTGAIPIAQESHRSIKSSKLDAQSAHGATSGLKLPPINDKKSQLAQKKAQRKKKKKRKAQEIKNGKTFQEGNDHHSDTDSKWATSSIATHQRTKSGANADLTPKGSLPIQLSKPLIKSNVDDADFSKINQALNIGIQYQNPSDVERLIREETINENNPLIENTDHYMEYSAIQNQDKIYFLVVEKSKYEKIRDYNDNKCCLGFRKKMMLSKLFIHQLCYIIIKNNVFEGISLFVILANSLTLAIEDPENPNEVIAFIDDIFLILYTIEMVLKILGLGFIFNKGAYLRDYWNILDFTIVVSAYISIALDGVVNLGVLRSFRVLRPLRTISGIEGLRILVSALISAMPLLRDTLLVLMFFFLIFGIAGLQLWSGILKQRCISLDTGRMHEDGEFCGSLECPDGYICGKMNENPNNGVTNVDNIFYSILLVFQCVTLEGWSVIMVMYQKCFNWLALFFFIPIVFIGSFFLINLTLAVIKSKFTEEHNQKKKSKGKRKQINPEDPNEVAKRKRQSNQLMKNLKLKFRAIMIIKRGVKRLLKRIRARKQGLPSPKFTDESAEELVKVDAFSGIPTFKSFLIGEKQAEEKDYDIYRGKVGVRKSNTLIPELPKEESKSGDFFKSHSKSKSHISKNIVSNLLTSSEEDGEGLINKLQEQKERHSFGGEENQQTKEEQKVRQAQENEIQQDYQLQEFIDDEDEEIEKAFESYLSRSQLSNQEECNNDQKTSQFQKFNRGSTFQNNSKKIFQKKSKPNITSLSAVPLSKSGKFDKTKFDSSIQQQNNNFLGQEESSLGVQEFAQRSSIESKSPKFLESGYLIEQKARSHSIQSMYLAKGQPTPTTKRSKRGASVQMSESGSKLGNSLTYSTYQDDLHSPFGKTHVNFKSPTSNLIQPAPLPKYKKTKSMDRKIPGTSEDEQQVSNHLIPKQSMDHQTAASEVKNENQDSQQNNQDSNQNNSEKEEKLEKMRGEVGMREKPAKTIQRGISKSPQPKQRKILKSQESSQSNKIIPVEMEQNKTITKRAVLFSSEDEPKQVQYRRDTINRAKNAPEVQVEGDIGDIIAGQDDIEDIDKLLSNDQKKLQVNWKSIKFSSQNDVLNAHLEEENERQKRAQQIIKYIASVKPYQKKANFFPKAQDQMIEILKQQEPESVENGSDEEYKAKIEAENAEEPEDPRKLQDEEEEANYELLNNFQEKFDKDFRSNFIVTGSLSLVVNPKDNNTEKKLIRKITIANDNRVPTMPIDSLHTEQDILPPEPVLERLDRDIAATPESQYSRPGSSRRKPQTSRPSSSKIHSRVASQQNIPIHLQGGAVTTLSKSSSKKGPGSMIQTQIKNGHYIMSNTWNMKKESKDYNKRFGVMNDAQLLRYTLKKINKDVVESDYYDHMAYKAGNVDHYVKISHGEVDNVKVVDEKPDLTEEDESSEQEEGANKTGGSNKLKKQPTFKSKLKNNKALNDFITRMQKLSTVKQQKQAQTSLEQKTKLAQIASKLNASKSRRTQLQTNDSSDSESGNDGGEADDEGVGGIQDEFLDINVNIPKIIKKHIKIERDLRIMNYEWSGQDVKPLGDPDNIQYAIKQLSRIRVWPKGCFGLYKFTRSQIKSLVRAGIFDNFMTLCVFANTITLSIDHYDINPNTGAVLDLFNMIFTVIFIVEFGLKLIGLGLKKYLSDSMNYLDGLVVILSIVELAFLSGGDDGDGSGSALSAFRTVRIFRTFRVLRVARLLRSLQSMQIIIGVISRSIKSFMYLAILLLLFIFIYSLLGMQIFRGEFVFADRTPRFTFDSFPRAFVTVFIVLTMENWQVILFDAMNAVEPIIAGIYLISWIFLGNFVLLNLFLAILLDSFVEEDEEAHHIDDEDDDITLALKQEAEEEDQDDDDDDNHYHVGDKETEQNEQLFVEINDLPIVDITGQGKQKAKKFIKKKKKTQKGGTNLLDESFEINPEVLSKRIDIKSLLKKKEELFKDNECQKAFYIFSQENPLRIGAYKFFKWTGFEYIVLVMIILSSIKLVYDTYIIKLPEDNIQKRISFYVDYVFSIFFLVESLVKATALGLCLDKGTYLRETWNQLDFFIVASSMVDMFFEGVDVGALKILRLLRTLRPLRFISHNSAMKTVVVALLQSIKGIFNVLIVVLIVWLMFAIFGINLYGGKFQYCDSDDKFSIETKQQCEDLGNKWKTYDSNFDDAIQGMMTLFIVSSLEGWPDVMLQAVDNMGLETGPKPDADPLQAFFFIGFILIGSFFFLNFFVGVIFMNFEEAQKEEKASLILKDRQVKWIDMMKMIVKAKPDLESAYVPKGCIRLKLYKFVTLNAFDVFIMVCIVLNMIQMAMAYEGQTQGYTDGLEVVNLIFTSVFALEAVLKLGAFGLKYFKNGWNKFDFIVVIASLFDIAMSQMGENSVKFLRAGPQLARVLRVLRVSRLFRLINKYKGLQALLQTIQFSLPSLFNVFALLMLIFFIYAVLGVFVFGEITEGEEINDFINFQNFGNGMITLLRVSTGEDWNKIMYDTMRLPPDCIEGKTCGTPYAPMFFISFILICTFVMLNLFILVILQQFEEYYLPDDNILSQFKNDLETFKTQWTEYTRSTLGIKIRDNRLVDFFQFLDEPLGMSNLKKKDIIKEIVKMELMSDSQGFIYFNDLLFKTMRRVYGEESVKNKTLADMEVKTMKKLQDIKYKQVKKSQEGEINIANPFLSRMFYKISYRAWLNQWQLHKENERKGIQNDTIDEESVEEFEEETIELQSFQKDEEDDAGASPVQDSQHSSPQQQEYQEIIEHQEEEDRKDDEDVAVIAEEMGNNPTFSSDEMQSDARGSNAIAHIQPNDFEVTTTQDLQQLNNGQQQFGSNNGPRLTVSIKIKLEQDGAERVAYAKNYM